MTTDIDGVLAEAHEIGVLTIQEAHALAQLATVDDPPPAWLFPAVERLYLWCECDGALPN
jgi:hypothetical protein